MTLSKKPYKGTRDFYPIDQRKQDYIFNKMRKVCNSFGYEHYNGPILEEVDLYKAKSGEELINDQIYSFTDRGNRFVAIRPEMTPTLARMIASKGRELTKPIRWYSIPNLMRYEKPQRGRLREHWQLNVDIFDSKSPFGIFEILNMLIYILQDFGATRDQFCILLNNRKIVDKLFKNVLKLDEETSYKTYKLIDRSKKISQEKLQKDLEVIINDQNKEKIINDYIKLNSLDELYRFLENYDLNEANNEFKTLMKLMNDLNLSDYVVYDPCIVRGLDYYTGFVFELFDKNPENPRAICGGGEYENILKIFNEKPLPGVGFGLGDVTLADFLTTHNLLPSFEKQGCDLLITLQIDHSIEKIAQLANSLRKTDLKIIINYDQVKIKKVFPLAEKLGARFVALVGENEISNSNIQIKDMSTRDQHNINITDITQIHNIIK